MSEDRESEDLTLETPVGEGTDTAPERQEHIEGEDGEGALDVSFGDEATPEGEGPQDSGLVKKLRAEIRDRDAKLAELAKTVTPKPIEVGEKPTLEGCDFDGEQFEQALDAWKARKAEADNAGAAAKQQQEETAKAWAVELQGFAQKRAALKAPDFEAAEEEVVAGLTQTQQAIIVKASDDSAKVIYALGKHPAKLAELSKISDPIKFTAAIVKLEGTIKLAPRRKAPEPEGTVRGSAQLSPKSDKHLEKLETDAAKSGDRSAVIAYKRNLKAQGR